MAVHDDQEREEILAALKELPPDHPAWVAYNDGADAIQLIHLVKGHRELVSRLIAAWFAGHARRFGQRR